MTTDGNIAIIFIYSAADMKIEATCPICLLDLVQTQNLVHCEHCHNKLHNDCMAICKYAAVH